MPTLPSSAVFDALRVTESAARAAAPWVGRGQKARADAAAVEAMAAAFETASVRGHIVVGEGEKDDAPLLAPGQTVGPETASPVDVAVDPVDGTRLLAEGRPGAMAVLALAPRGSLQPLGAAFYLEKIVAPAATADVLDLDRPPGEVAHAMAEVLDVPPRELVVAVQDRPRHAALVAALRNAGVRVKQFQDGDLGFALQATLPGTGVDALWGIGGAPEGVLTACALHVLPGALTARLAPQSEAERDRLRAAGLDTTALYGTADLATSSDVVMVATGITRGLLLDGIHPERDRRTCESLVLTGADQTVRRVYAREGRGLERGG